MLIVMKRDATAEQVAGVVARIETMGLKANAIPGAQRIAIGITGNLGALDRGSFEALPGVFEVIRVSHPFKLVSREFQPNDTVVTVGSNGGAAGADRAVAVGGPELVVISGPCSIESYEQTLRLAERVRAAGAQLFRGGAYKPRTSPYSFQGLGLPGLEILARVSQEVGLPTVTEALDIDVLDAVAEHADLVQIGARNMQNYTLLKRAGRCGKPILLKRGMTSTVTELLLAAEYILDQGNPNVILCERGIRTFADHARNTLDLSAIPAIEKISHLPVIVDPSHAAGKSGMVRPLARAAVAAGADGVMIEIHDRPSEALSDSEQAIHPDEMDRLMAELRALAPVVERRLSAGGAQ